MMILAAMTAFQWALCLGLILVCVGLMVVILLQRGRGGGLSAAFGGGGGGTSAFGAKTGDVFTLITVVLAAVYLCIAVIGNYIFLPPPGLEPGATAEVIEAADTGSEEESAAPAATPTGESEATPPPAPPTEKNQPVDDTADPEQP